MSKTFEDIDVGKYFIKISNHTGITTKNKQLGFYFIKYFCKARETINKEITYNLHKTYLPGFTETMGYYQECIKNF